MPGELRGVQNQLSNFGDDRPISAVAFAPGSGLCATGSWSHMVKIWSVPDCKQVQPTRSSSTATPYARAATPLCTPYPRYTPYPC